MSGKSISTNRDLSLALAWLKSSHVSSYPRPLPSDSRVFVTPHCVEYFQNSFPKALPKASKVRAVLVVTDLDIKMWNAQQSGPPLWAFDDFIQSVSKDKTQAARVDRYLEDLFCRTMGRTPKVVYFHEDPTIAVMVLPATETAAFHLKEMAGICCTDAFDSFPTKDVHTALMHHEWAHLEVDQGLTPLEKEIRSDAAAIDFLQDPIAKQAWIDARIMGGFMWPFPERQNGMAFVDSRFQRRPYQEIQMKVIHDWCENVFHRFYTKERMEKIYGLLLNMGDVNHIYIEEETFQILKQQARDAWQSGLPDDVEGFKDWIKERGGEFPSHQEKAWSYIKTAFVMNLQISGANEPDLYVGLYGFAKEICDAIPERETLARMVYKNFTEAFERVAPFVREVRPNLQPPITTVRGTHLPGIEYL